ncbi:EAL domain-containing protein [Sphingomonas sp. 1P06PA]|uniref:putative bifunctional diguanylate cyclase/phosphodiesterase n=1 Tax=Sphingomonas sp. 1P06PA TaxID=554121 RepID=UPI0039A4FF82
MRSPIGTARGIERRSAVVIARHDLVAGGVTIAAILLFVGTGGEAMRSAVHLARGVGVELDGILSSALLLNVALLLFGWRRYRDLKREVCDRTAAEDRAQTLASRDALTGLHNRRALIELAGGAMAQAERRGKAIALLLIDLDQFKHVNDMHGHSMGDLLLRECAAMIESLLPPNAIVARLGGDEFACAFVFDPGHPDIVSLAAERIVTQLARPFEFGATAAHVGASVGVARSDHDCGSIEAMLRRADIAMYAAKKAGRNRYTWFDASMEREVEARNAIEEGLRRGIPAGEIVPFYEQQIDLATGVLNGFEVLARWNHPTRGLIMPDLFIPIAEECGLIGDLSVSIMRQAFEQARGWDPSLTLSVNISPAQLRDPWLAQKIVKLLVETGFPPSRLEIEITESSLYENLGLAQSIVGSLKNQGIRLALDDFGTGYSSLAHLRAMPFDRIKIDKSFVTSMIENSESAAIVGAITKLGESLGLPITAEGIENAGIEARLVELGCAKGQGWHFGRPMSIGQVRTLLAGRDQMLTGRGEARDVA